jgi:hypothetical protein
MNTKLKLKPIPIEWQLGKYGIFIEASEGDRLSIKTKGVNLKKEIIDLIIEFKSFAEFRFFNFNFEEHNYGDFFVQIPSGDYVEDTFPISENYASFWEEEGICPDSYFYEIDSSIIFESKEIYGDLLKRKFRHYILVGYDSYVEILAQENFEIKIIPA